MFAVCSIQDLNMLSSQNKIVSVLLADSFDHQLLEWIYNSWQALHFESGMNWHLVIPSKESVFNLSGDEKRFSLRDYSSNLAREVSREMGVPRNAFPCLVFDNKNREKNAIIKLKSRGNDQLKDLMLRLAKQFRHANFDDLSEQGIEKLILEVAMEAETKRILHGFFGRCANAASLISLKP